ncbi:DUF7289 family protein [Halobellus sp. EA9]|uniref:DUF7289 family protein n=1 Tax=Halobellus sp. EA9 TaxID=3421647 RepID=UPI003EC0DD0A
MGDSDIDRGVSSNIGLVLLLALTIVGAGVVVAVGSSALADVQNEASLDRTANAMTLLDARTAIVGLGEGSVQTVRLGRVEGGRYTADAESGWIRVRHRNYTESEDETIYNASLGAVAYEDGETTIAYQGGGVWRARDGGTSMVSPPEFHYRGTTLTLPVIRIRSNDAASGTTTATIRRTHETVRIFPNETGTDTDGVGAPYDVDDPDGSTRQYVNPVRNGTVSVTVHSQFYEGWADYFRTRTSGNVSVDDDARTATVVLETTRGVGTFDFPQKEDSIAVRGIAAGHAVTDFQVSVRKDDGTFNNLYVSFYIEEGSKAWETRVGVPNGIGNSYCPGQASTESVSMDVYYHDAATPEGVHLWSNDSIPSDSGPVQLACDGEDMIIQVDFTSPDQPLTYTDGDFDGDDGDDGDETALDWADRNDSSAQAPSPTTFAHPGDDGENTTYSFGDRQNLRILTRHYFATFDSDFELAVSHGPGDRGTSQIDVSGSGGTLRYNTTGEGSYITYLHVTENNVSVALN